MVLKTEIPPQKIEGTPHPIKVPGLEPAPKAAPQITVPEGTVVGLLAVWVGHRVWVTWQGG